TTNADQNYGEIVNLGANALLAAGSGNITLSKAVTATGASKLARTGSRTTNINGGSVTTNADQNYGEIVNLGANALLAAGSGNITLSKAVTATGTSSLTITGTGTTNINGGSVTTNADQSYGEIVNLGVNTTLASGSGNITLSKAVPATGPSSLTLTRTGTTNRNAASVTTNADQNYGEIVNLGVNTTLASGTGNVIFGKAVTATGASTLTVNGSGTTQINGGSVTTNANQTYNEVVSLGANATLAAGTGNV